MVEYVQIYIDDLSDEVDEKLVGSLFTKKSHHRNISIIFLVNNLYFRGLKNMRDISLNTHFTVLMRSARDRSSVVTLARQMFAGNYKYLLDAFDDATKTPYSYLLIDSKPSTPNPLRLRSKIFPGETTVCYLPKHGKKTT